jgi:hypothetical protein
MAESVTLRSITLLRDPPAKEYRRVQQVFCTPPAVSYTVHTPFIHDQLFHYRSVQQMLYTRRAVSYTVHTPFIHDELFHTQVVSADISYTKNYFIHELFR